MARAQEVEDSVYDFLYVDNRRIGLLLSQFGEDGVLTELTRTSGVDSESSGGLDLKVVQAGHKEAATTGLSRTFDPRWLLPLRFLDVAQSLINREAVKAGIGQVVLVAGDLWVIDLSILKNMIGDPALSKLLLKPEKAPAGPRQVKNAGQDSMSFGMAVMKVMPHAIQARLTSSNASFWASLSEDGLTTGPADLFLKHGLKIAGEWSMVGILDAIPDENLHPTQLNVQAAIDAANLGAYAGGLAMMTPHIRPILGRPAQAYGITPLLVFREVSRA
jgi:hypothetical protein